MSLTFTPKISKYANLYFFIQNLSEWHLSNRKDHNIAWHNELHLSNEAKNDLQEFKKIHEQYPFGDKFLGRPFFLYDDPWSEIELLVGKNNTTSIKNIFTTLEPYFNMIYIKDEIFLKDWLSIIERPDFIKNTSHINNILANLYGCKPYNQNCIIYLLLSTEKRNGGTAGTISDNSITLELSRTSIESKEHISNVIWHELIHLYFRKHTLYPLLEKLTDSNWKIMGKIDEIIASSLLPNGLLKSHTLVVVDESIKSNKFNSLISSKKIINTQKLIYPYLQEKKIIDSKLLKKLYSMLKVDK